MKSASFSGIVSHGLLALAALCGASVAVSGPIQTTTSTLTLILGGSDADTSTSGNSES